MTFCDCRLPREPNDPRFAGKGRCVCGRFMDPDWTCGDASVKDFFDRLASTIPARDETWNLFRLDCEERERAGRPTFGQVFLTRHNLREAAEEAADGALYAMLDTLVVKREGRGDEDIDLALIAAHHFYKAYEATVRLREKRRGAP